MPTGILETPVPPLTPPSTAQPAASVGTTASYTATPYTSTPYTATPYTVQPESLVQEQVRRIVGEDSPLMQQARTKASQTMNARGLLNSTLNTQAGQEAVIAQSLPIAQADAAAYDRAMTNTANQENAARQFGAAATNQAAQANAAAINAASQFGAGAVNTTAQANLQAQSQMAIAKLDATTRENLALLETQNRQLLQASTAASQAYVQAVTNISNISSSNTLSEDAKDDAIATQMDSLRQQLSVIGGIASTEAAAVTNLNLGQYYQNVPVGSGSTTTASSAHPITNTNPLTSQWSDGRLHTPPAAGFAIEVPGFGWWGHDGKFYPTQAEAINLAVGVGTTGANPSAPAAPATPVPAPKLGTPYSTANPHQIPPANLQWASGRAGYKSMGKFGWMWADAQGKTA